MRDERGWFAVLSSRELGPGPLALRRFGVDFVLFRDAEGKAHALEDRCPHRRTRLSLGRVRDGCIECPFHGFRFDGEGACRALPAHDPDAPPPKAMRAQGRPLREEDGYVFLWGHSKLPPQGDPPRLPQAHAGFSYGELVAEWEAHYARVIENQLDYAHLPFVHATTIGRGMNPRVEAHIEEEPGRIRYHAFTRGGAPNPHQFIEWRAPNLWVNQITPGFFITVAFAPVDERRTRLYLRTYQRYIRIPLLRDVVNILFRYFNRKVLRQDQRVVEQQDPQDTHLRIDEILVPFDRPIIAFRRQRALWSEPTSDVH